MASSLPAVFLSLVRPSRVAKCAHTNRWPGATVLFGFLLALTASAQVSDDVHIVPRAKVERTDLGSKHSASRRLRADVDSVLAPLTVSGVRNHRVVDPTRHNFRRGHGSSAA